MKPGEVLVLAEKLVAVIEEANQLDVGEEIDVPEIRFKAGGHGYALRNGKLVRTR